MIIVLIRSTEGVLPARNFHIFQIQLSTLTLTPTPLDTQPLNPYHPLVFTSHQPRDFTHMTKLNLQDLINHHQDLNGLTKADATNQVKSVLATLQTVTDTTESQLTLRGFGKFTRTLRSGYVGRNPQTGESVQVAAKQTLRFSPAK